jgi:hypothetical protein
MNKPLEPESPRPEETLDVTASTATAEDLALEAFDLWMDRELEKLVARWVHLAAPNAEQASFRRNRGL